ncbi:hypothetical protein N0V93_004358 [Gnomoniopsis smithogilvyi]|uniref:Glucose-methanol-choline oxidoreductase N-terminal domain-containing protein n=1 Tax=Gnomoniopsis smithogilvyi TaxID=1191159 RepID=A0A9W8YTK6_9PEZI|nr:hypothetical protein N0V93_004358 [Gnomoniopsis smithogilvyi]
MANNSDTQPYDYIVVGGGTSGLVVASRLTEDPNVSVLVIEAGGDKSQDPFVNTPGFMGALYGKEEYDWNFSSVPQHTLNNRVINQCRGKMLGGSSSLNFLMMVYPSRAILDTWGALGNKDWNFETMAPYFRKFARTHLPTEAAKKNCHMDGVYDPLISKDESGPLDLSFGEGFGPNNHAWMEAFKNLGLGAKMDPRSGAAIGAFQQAATIHPETKTRTSAVTAYLNEDVRKRSNLTVITDTMVKRVILEPVDGSDEFFAKGVEVRSKDGSEKTILAAGEVVLAAGALQTPQILELSGIGDRKLLEKYDVPVKIDNPNVGEHMQDHPILCQSFEVADGVMSGDVMRDPNLLQAVIAQYQTNREGPLGQSLISSAYVPMADDSGVLDSEARIKLLNKYLSTGADKTSRYSTKEQEVIKNLLATTNEPTYQFLLFPTQINVPQHPESMSTYITPVAPENYVTVMAMLNHPFSRGSCHIKSSNFEDAPVWDPRYNDQDVDLELLAGAAQFTETLIATEPFKGLFKPDGKRMQVKADTLEGAREVVRSRQISVFHISSSAVMLPKEAGGVVDHRLKVYGVKNLRVVDASVFPIEPLGNIQATVYAVAERAADILKEDRLGSKLEQLEIK